MLGLLLLIGPALAQSPRHGPVADPTPPAVTAPQTPSVDGNAAAPAPSQPAAQPEAQAPQAEPGTTPSSQPGLLGALGRLLDQSAEQWNAGMRDARGAIDEIGERSRQAAKSAVDTVTKLPGVARLVEGRERCAPAPNGAPDCRTASDQLCRAKGYAGGKSADIVTAQKCPAQVWLQRRQPLEGECAVETFVTRAVCQ